MDDLLLLLTLAACILLDSDITLLRYISRGYLIGMVMML